MGRDWDLTDPITHPVGRRSVFQLLNYSSSFLKIFRKGFVGGTEKKEEEEASEEGPGRKKDL